MPFNTNFELEKADDLIFFFDNCQKFEQNMRAKVRKEDQERFKNIFISLKKQSIANADEASIKEYLTAQVDIKSGVKEESANAPAPTV